MDTEQDIELYVERVEMRTTATGEVDDDWAIFYCTAGDVYQAFFEDGGWWIQAFPGDPSDGPFASVDDVADWINTAEW